MERINDSETEEFHKSLLSDFLKRTYFSPHHFINTKGRNDLVIHNAKEPTSSVGVILEVKKPGNRNEMVQLGDLNKKALHELLLYYLRDRLTDGNIELKHLAITNISEWFVFDARSFETCFARNPKLTRLYGDFEAGRLSGNTTDFFYREIAAPFLAELSQPLELTYFSLSDYAAALARRSEEGDRKLIPLYKFFSPTHLLKQPFQNDSNTLDRGFYSELLHILGLEEKKKGQKRLIGRKAETTREAGSIIESAAIQLSDLQRMSRLKSSERYGANRDEQLFGVSLELAITWINRLIFLKLLEAQLLDFHKDDSRYAFLDEHHVADFDELNSLFFSVLAKEFSDRSQEHQSLYPFVPYLNSSLFEPSELEHSSIFVSNLRNVQPLSIHSSTVLKDDRGKKRKGSLSCLAYLFEFFDAFDFAGDGSEAIQEESKKLINATVLGLIFEKINGYKDGSYFTPGAITMYICRSSIRRAVLTRFNETKGWSCRTFDELYSLIADKSEANRIINSITICDPAVGSGHFLVSALNELISIKAELKVLLDRQGRTLRDYHIETINDELIITDDDGRLFEYRPDNPESLRVQEALFHEKQTIIENCLFGVDINHNSVKICRLRLWIELLKNAYYKQGTAPPSLETLPNIDINIKCGDSLISRYDLTSDLGKVLRKSKRTIADYREAVRLYQEATDKDRKRELEVLIETIKSDFRSSISRQQLDNLNEELRALENQASLFEVDSAKKAQVSKKKKRLRERIAREQERQEMGDALFDFAFEWRFEFPQVLDSNGEFIGFDVVIGNPPYGLSITGTKRTHLERTLGKVPDFEIYYLFINQARRITRKQGSIGLIVPNSILFNVYAQEYRETFLEQWKVQEIVDCTDFAIFPDATVRNAILLVTKEGTDGPIGYKQTADVANLDELLNRQTSFAKRELMLENNHNWALVFRRPHEVLELVSAIRRTSRPLIELFPEVSQGLIAYDKHTGQNVDVIKTRAFHASNRINESYKPWLWGEDVTRYSVSWNRQEYLCYSDRIANPRQPKFFSQPRILVREITNPHIFAAFTRSELYNDPAIINILDENSVDMPIYCLLGILNSRLATFYHLNSSPKIAKGAFPKILVTDVKSFPLPQGGDKETQNEIARLAREATEKRADDRYADINQIEQSIDEAVFKLYALSVEDISVINSQLLGI